MIQRIPWIAGFALVTVMAVVLSLTAESVKADRHHSCNHCGAANANAETDCASHGGVSSINCANYSTVYCNDGYFCDYYCDGSGQVVRRCQY